MLKTSLSKSNRAKECFICYDEINLLLRAVVKLIY